jgi:hypothetical protein
LNTFFALLDFGSRDEERRTKSKGRSKEDEEGRRTIRLIIDYLDEIATPSTPSTAHGMTPGGCELGRGAVARGSLVARCSGTPEMGGEGVDISG